MANNPYHRGMEIRLDPPGKPEMRQILMISPPMASTHEEYLLNKPGMPVPRELSDDVLETIQKYVASEDSRKPYTEAEIFKHVIDQGYDINRRDVAIARKMLGIKASKLRKQKV